MNLTYGPVGDPESSDPFERAQARMPEGWHVEGQVTLDRTHWFAARATTKGDRGVTAYGRTPAEALDTLVTQVQDYHLDLHRRFAAFHWKVGEVQLPPPDPDLMDVTGEKAEPNKPVQIRRWGR